MKTPWILLLAVGLALAGCSPDRTVDTLVPRTALAVVLVENPGWVEAVYGAQVRDFPWKSLDGGKPWAAAAVPGSPPGFLLALALADKPGVWETVRTWARDRGGLEAARLGSYAVLTTPGQPAPTAYDPDSRFDLSRARVAGDPVGVYVDAANLRALGSGPVPALPPWVADNLAGLKVGFSEKAGGLQVRVVTDWRPGAPAARTLRFTEEPADLGPWTGLLPRGDGVGVAGKLPAEGWAELGPLLGPGLSARWAALAPLLGPRAAVSAVPRADGTWAWAAAVEARDPQAVRQAFKTLVAGGDLQKNFGAWALDPDTPLVYRDRPDGLGGVLASVSLGSEAFQVGYGSDRVSFAGGAGAEEAVRAWRRTSGTAAPWFGEAPAGARLVASGGFDGLGARGSLGTLADGNWELRVWVDAAGLRSWEERLPQVLVQWVSGAGGWTRWEP